MYVIDKIISKTNKSEIYIVEKDNKKFIKKRAFNNININMLKNEVNVLNRLKDCSFVPNIVEYVFSDSDNYIITEYIDGDMLFKYNFDSLRDKFIIISKLCGILIELHERGIIHGDLKPENILINKDGEIKLIDFGVSVIDDKNYFPNTGTKIYCSLEHLQKNEKLNPCSDLYSVGIIFYELITGELPFEKDNIVSNKLNVNYKPTKNIYINIIFDRIFNPNNLNKYGSVVELKKELDTLLS